MTNQETDSYKAFLRCKAALEVIAELVQNIGGDRIYFISSDLKANMTESEYEILSTEWSKSYPTTIMNYDDFRKYYNKEYDETVDWMEAENQLKDLHSRVVVHKENTQRTYEWLYGIYEQKEAVQKKRVDDPEVLQQVAFIEQLIKTKHNQALTKESTVFHIYNDGRITFQKGADLYLWRSEFRKVDPIILPRKPVFPIIYEEDISYAIVTPPDAQLVRTEILKLLAK